MLLFLLAFLVVVGVGAGSYYLGMRQAAPLYTTTMPTTAAMPAAVPSAMPTASSASAQLVQAGGVLSLKAYTATVPAGWTVTHNVKTNSDQLMIAQGGYTVNIWQVAGGGGACSYPDHMLTTGIFKDYTTFVQLTDQDGMTYRRGSDGIVADNTGMHYTVCELSQGSFSELTPFGVIFYTTPLSPTTAMLNEMDSIVSSLKAQ